jgi:hypothetical protein
VDRRGEERGATVPPWAWRSPKVSNVLSASTSGLARDLQRGRTTWRRAVNLNFDAFFQEYAEIFNRSLGDTVDVEGIRSHFTDCFVAAGSTGVVCGHNDDTFRETLERGYAFYKTIGTKHLKLLRTEVSAIDDFHHVVKAFYQAQYDKRTGEEVAIDFDVTYMLQTREGRSKIFAWVAGDEMTLYEKHGLLEGSSA